MNSGWLRRTRSGGVALAFLVGLLTAGFYHLPHQSAAQQRSLPGVAVNATRTAPSAAVGSLQDLSEAFASIAEHIKPSVVYIKSGHKPQASRNSPRLQIPPGLEPFFRNESAAAGNCGTSAAYVLT